MIELLHNYQYCVSYYFFDKNEYKEKKYFKNTIQYFYGQKKQLNIFKKIEKLFYLKYLLYILSYIGHINNPICLLITTV